jgi:molybdopterin/thiamine biosynthesis adenylyltransferase
MAFAFGRHVTTCDGTIFLVHELILPDSTDLATQSTCGVSPSSPFLQKVYEHAYRTRQSIVEFHTHPGTERPHFSGIDEHHGYRNAGYIAEKFTAPVTLVLIVGNNLFDSFDGVVYDRQRELFRQLDRLEFLGKPTVTWTLGESDELRTSQVDETFDRQRRIPGWNQTALERQRIGIVGAGGDGAPLIQSLLAMGAAIKGFFAVADHDVVEESNLPRIPYANRCHIGTPKVAVATLFAGQKSPSTPFYAFPCRFDEQAVQKRFKAVNVLFYCGDNDGGRKEANAFAVRYGIPLIDLGCDVQVSDNKVEAGGQVRLVLPGENACLVCCGGFDAAQAAKDQMTDADRAQQAARGYVMGANAEATPSVANLNGLTVQFALSQFLALVNGPEFARWDYLHFDQFTGQTIPAISTQHEKCPTCGPAGTFMKGDPPHGRTSPATPRPVRYTCDPTAETPADMSAGYPSPPLWHPASATPDAPGDTPQGPDGPWQ